MRDISLQIEELLEEKVRPLLIDRGGDVSLQGFREGVVELAMVGSPGASVPIRNAIRNLMKHYLPDVVDVQLVASTETDTSADDESVTARTQRVLTERIQPAVQHHGGFIRLVEVKDRTAFLRFEEACQGCAMAQVTLRQGVEVVIREKVPEIVAVVDVTDHTQGTKPYFKTKKG